jgi:transcriptional regulator with XRE-family HTH domain
MPGSPQLMEAFVSQLPAENSGICRRVAQLRTQVAGARGKAAFARMLGISPSTYDYYESGRLPPADLLVRMAHVANADLLWLLTGRSHAANGGPHPLVRRTATLLAERPSTAAALSAFLDLLEALPADR